LQQCGLLRIEVAMMGEASVFGEINVLTELPATSSRRHASIALPYRKQLIYLPVHTKQTRNAWRW
jgi:hypothetical protein